MLCVRSAAAFASQSSQFHVLLNVADLQTVKLGASWQLHESKTRQCYNCLQGLASMHKKANRNKQKLLANMTRKQLIAQTENASFLKG